MNSLVIELILQLIVYPLIMASVIASTILFLYYNSKSRRVSTMMSLQSAIEKAKQELISHGYAKYLEGLDNASLLNELETLKKEFQKTAPDTSNIQNINNFSMHTEAKILLIKEALRNKNIPQWIIDKV